MERKSPFQKKIDKLLSRQEYLVVQANDLAKAFGNLKAFEHRILDFCFSYVTAESNPRQEFVTTVKEITNHFGINESGKNYENIVQAFKTLNEGTPLYFLEENQDGSQSLVMAHLFQKIKCEKSGQILFQFSDTAAPYVFHLRKNFYSFKLRELSQIKSKYTMILMKIWESHRYGNNSTTFIEGSLEDFKTWFLGSEIVKNPEKSEKWNSARFTQKVLRVAMEEIETKLPSVVIEFRSIKEGRKVVGYQIQIHDHRTRR